jgi:hypothetical protein
MKCCPLQRPGLAYLLTDICCRCGCHSLCGVQLRCGRPSPVSACSRWSSLAGAESYALLVLNPMPLTRVVLSGPALQQAG